MEPIALDCHSRRSNEQVQPIAGLDKVSRGPYAMHDTGKLTLEVPFVWTRLITITLVSTPCQIRGANCMC